MYLLQVKHPDHSYQGMTDMKECPSFIQDFDCLADYVDPRYRQLGQKVQPLTGLLTGGQTGQGLVT